MAKTKRTKEEIVATATKLLNAKKAKKKEPKAILKFIIKDSESWNGDKYKNKECKVFSYEFVEGSYDEPNKPSRLVVSNNLPWDIYGSSTFEKEITKLVKAENPKMKIKRIAFSEQGMQENKTADMDISY